MGHLEQSKDRIRDGDLIHAFVPKYFSYWLEAMSLVEEASKIVVLPEMVPAILKRGSSSCVQVLLSLSRGEVCPKWKAEAR